MEVPRRFFLFLCCLFFLFGSLRSLNAGFRFYNNENKKVGLPRLTPQEPGLDYNFLQRTKIKVLLPNLGVILYRHPQIWQFFVVVFLKMEGEKT